MKARVEEGRNRYDQTVEVSSRGFNKDLYFNVDCWRCPNPGCNVFGRNTEEHEKDGCQARTVPCITEDCDHRIPLYLLSEHLVEMHGHTISDNPVNIYENGIVGISKDYEESPGESREEDIMWDIDEILLPFSITRSGKIDPTFRDRHSIFPRFIKEGLVYYMYLRINANQEVADKYWADLEVKSSTHKINKSNARVYSVDVPWNEVKRDGQRRGGGVLVIKPYMAEHFGSLEESEAGRRCFVTHYQVHYPCWP